MHSYGHQSCIRGEIVGEWVLARGVDILNVPSDLYTFDRPSGVSDIEVKAAKTAYQFCWHIVDVRGVSGYNVI